MMKITDQQWWKMVDAGMSKPLSLNKADLTKPFVYQRGWGVSYVNPGHHQAAMRLLYTFHLGYIRLNDMFKVSGFNEFNEMEQASDAWAQLPGTAWRSSVGKTIECNDLNVSEMRFLL